MKENLVLEVKDLVKTFAIPSKKQKNDGITRLTAVNKLNLEVHKGEIYGLLGPNGAGKSTTLKIIASLLSADAGSINILGEDLFKKGEEVRTKVGYLTCDLKLDPYFTPDYTFLFFYRLYGLDPSKMEERKRELFEEFGISNFANRKISKLSTGMAQKVALAISLIHDPKLIVYDEPTNGLDIFASKVVEEFLIKLKQKGKAIIISTHILSLIEKIADRVGILDKGQLLYEEDIKTIKDSGGLEKVFFSVAIEEVEA